MVWNGGVDRTSFDVLQRSRSLPPSVLPLLPFISLYPRKRKGTAAFIGGRREESPFLLPSSRFFDSLRRLTYPSIPECVGLQRWSCTCSHRYSTGVNPPSLSHSQLWHSSFGGRFSWTLFFQKTRSFPSFLKTLGMSQVVELVTTS